MTKTMRLAFVGTVVTAISFSFEVRAQLTELGGDFRISTQGPDGDTTFDAWRPATSYNATDNEYLVTWHGDRIANEWEIYGQRLDGSGSPLGSNFRRTDLSFSPIGDSGWQLA